MHIKSERLKKLETELNDLNQWLSLGLVPKKDLEKHKEEITALEGRISEEKRRLQQLKESGDLEEFALPKKPAHGRQAFQDPHSLPDIDIGEEGVTDLDLDMETESFNTETNTGEVTGESDISPKEKEEDDPFSDRNRWKRGILEDPDSNDW